MKRRALPATLNLALLVVTLSFCSAGQGSSVEAGESAAAIMERAAEFYEGLRAISGQMVVEANLPEDLPIMGGIPAAHYDFALKTPSQFSFKPQESDQEPILVQNDTERFIELPFIKSYALTPAVSIEESGKEDENLHVPGADLVIGFMLGGKTDLSLLRSAEATLIGEEPLDGTDCYRLSVKGKVHKGEIWIAKGKEPWILRFFDEKPPPPKKKPQEGKDGSMVLEIRPRMDYRLSAWKTTPDLGDAFRIEPRSGFKKVDNLVTAIRNMNPGMGQAPSGPSGPGRGHPSKGKPAPTVAFKDMDGNSVNLSSLKGKVVVLDFWATWCKPCIYALPKVTELMNKMSDKGVVYYAINVAETEERVKKFLEAQNLQIPLVMDLQAAVSRAFGVNGIPHLAIIDTKGVVSNVHIGYGPGMENMLKAEVEALLQ